MVFGEGGRLGGSSGPARAPRGEFRGSGELSSTASSLQREDGGDLADSLYRAIVDTAVDAVVVIDGNGAIRSVNNATEWLFGYAAAPAVQLARALEERGFESMWAPEHSHIPVPRITS